MPPKSKKDTGSNAEPSQDDHRKRRRNRTTQSCLNCHTSKRMCDRRRPCGRCTQLGITGLCVYEVDDPNRHTDIEDETNRLRARVAELEGVIRELKNKPNPRWTNQDSSEWIGERWQTARGKARHAAGGRSRASSSSSSYTPSSGGGNSGMSGSESTFEPAFPPQTSVTPPSPGADYPSIMQQDANTGSVSFPPFGQNLYDDFLSSLSPAESASLFGPPIEPHHVHSRGSNGGTPCGCFSSLEAGSISRDLAPRLRRAADSTGCNTASPFDSNCELRRRLQELEGYLRSIGTPASNSAWTNESERTITGARHPSFPRQHNLVSPLEAFSNSAGASSSSPVHGYWATSDDGRRRVESVFDTSGIDDFMSWDPTRPHPWSGQR